MQKRQQQAKQAPWSNKLSVLDTHKLLKEHLRMAPPPPCPAPPGFHVRKRGKKSAVSLQVEAFLPKATYPLFTCHSFASGLPTCQQLEGKQEDFSARQLSKHLLESAW